jgi:hypothetical protein
MQDFNELELNQKIDLPFECCYFQSDAPFIIYEEDSIQNICGFLVKEDGPENTNVFGVGIITKDCASTIRVSLEKQNINKECEIHKFIILLLRNMAGSKNIGIEKVNIHIKRKENGIKKIHKIKTIIHVGKKNKLTEYEKKEHKKLDYSHRFEVMGHWRKVDVIGKNRNGEYNVNGYTWVVNHVRGDESKPLVIKKRIVAPIAGAEKATNAPLTQELKQ